jgi:hypothetical protein
MLAVLGLSTGCVTTQKSAEAAKPESKDEYVTVDAGVGSHIKRRVKKSDLAKETGVAPSKTEVITDETDTRAPGLTSGQAGNEGMARR